ncbi:hypothetical protein [Streptomyces sp. NPDC047928]|uniref:hypothetical protein n=1 Tax=unclassified Streptomyces TaxID=2593676 RepID=UPI0037166361
MVLLGQETTDAFRHRGPARGKTLAACAAAVAVVVAAGGAAIHTYGERPPWGDDIAYEAGFVTGNRIRHHDRDGHLTRDLLDGGCARMRDQGVGGPKAAHNPGRWVEGCLDGAAGRPSRHQGLM